MQKIISRLRNSNRFKKINYISLLLFLFAYCFAIPSFGSRDRWNYLVYALMAILAVLTITYSFLYKRIKLNRWFFPIPAFVAFSLIGTLLYSHAYRSFITLVLLAISFFVLYYCLSIIDNKKIILTILVSGLFVFSLYFIFVYRNQLLHFKDYIENGIHLGDYFDNPNGVSAFAIIGYTMSLYSLLFINKKYRWLFILPIFTLMVVGISTGSRTFVVAFIAITLVITFFKFKKHLLIYLTLVILFTLILIIMFNLPFLTTIRDKFIRIFWTFFTDSSRVDTSTIERTVWLDYGFYLGNKHLLTGLGVYGFSVFSGVGTYTHSNISEVWCDFGLPGFVLFYSSMVVCVIFSYINKSKNKSLILSIFIYYILVSFSNVFYYTKFFYFNVAFMYYLTFNAKSNGRSDTKNVVLDKIKNVVFTCDGMGSGGAEKVISILANQFVNNGLKVTIIGVSTHETSSFYSLNEKVEYITLHNGNKKRIRSLKRIRMLRKYFKMIKPSVIISFLPHVNVYTYYASFGLRMPVIVSERNNPKTDPKGFVLRRLKNIAFNVADGVVFQTNDAKWCYRKSIRDKSTIIYNPIDLKIKEIDVSNIKNNVVLSVGRLKEQKNFKCLIDAFAIFSVNHPEYILRIYGDGPLKEELEEYASSKGLEGKFQLKGNDVDWQVKEKDDAMFVLASNYEGMPNTLIEAIGIGIPSISTDCPIGGPKEIIKNGINGYLAKVNDSQDIANKMEELLNKPLEYDNKEFLSKFDVNVITSQWIDYIYKVIEGYHNE